MVYTERILSRPDFASDFVQDLQELWRHGKLCDSEIEVGSRVFKFHRIVLAVASAAFLDTNSSLPSDRLVIQLPVDTDVHALEAVLQYLYGNDITVTTQCVDTVLKLGNLFKIKSITEFCEQFTRQSEGCNCNNSRSKSAINRISSKGSRNDTAESLGKKTLNLGFKFPAPVRGLRRGRGSRGIGSGRGRGAVTASRGSGTNSRGQGRGRSRGRRATSRSCPTSSAGTKVKHEHVPKHSDVQNDTLDENDSVNLSSHSRKAKQTPSILTSSLMDDDLNEDSDGESKTTSETLLDNRYMGLSSSPRSSAGKLKACGNRKKSTMSDTDLSDYRCGQTEQECIGTTSAENSVLKIGPLTTRRRGRGACRPRAARGRPGLTLLSVFGTPAAGIDVTGTHSLSQSEIKTYLTRQRDIEKQKRYRDKMKNNPEWRKKEAERVRRRYVPVSQLSKKERLLRRQKENERTRRWRMQKKLERLHTPLEMVKDIEDMEGFSGEILVPHNSDLYLGNELLNTDERLHNDGEIVEPTIKQEVHDSGLDLSNSLDENVMQHDSLVDSITVSDMDITYHVTDTGDNFIDIPIEGENHASLEQGENDSAFLLENTSTDVTDDDELSLTYQVNVIDGKDPLPLDINISI